MNKLVKLEGTFNIRDLGGYKTPDNKIVKKGLVFRGDELSKLTEKDLNTLQNLPLTTVIDLRTPQEIDTLPNRLPASVKNTYFLPIDPGNMFRFKKISKKNVLEVMQEINRLMAQDFQETYAKFFQIIAKHAGEPLLFHCAAGKDRTGFGAALFLASLGVDEKTIVDDYLNSQPFVALKYAERIKQAPELAEALTVKPEYLQAALNVIKNEYGGMHSYLTRNLNVDLPKMQKLFLE